MHKRNSKAGVDAYLIHYENMKMDPGEKMLSYIIQLKEVKIKLSEVDHFVGDDKQKRVLFRGLLSEFSIIVGVVGAADMKLNDDIGLLLITEIASEASIETPSKHQQIAFPTSVKRHEIQCSFHEKSDA